jgi:hypothetical protein
MDLLFSPHVRWSQSAPQVVSNAAANRSIFTQAVRTLDRSGGVGDHYKIAISVENASNSNPYLGGYAERSMLRALTAQARGQVARWWIGDPSYVKRGSMPTGESLSNNVFIDGTSNWVESNSGVTLSATDRLLRVRRADGANSTAIRNTQAIAVTAFAPYVMRAHAVAGRGATGFGLRVGTTLGGVEVVESAVSTTGGMLSLVAVPATTSVYASLVDSFSGRMAGDYTSYPFTSFSRCALVDNAVNLLTRSDEFDHSDWVKIGVTVGANSTPAPDGTSTMDGLIENSANSAHMVTQNSAGLPAAAMDYAIAVEVTPGNRLYCFLQMDEGGSTTVTQYFNLSAGTVASGSTGAGWSNRRAAIVDLGDDRYLCLMIARKTTSATSIKAYIGGGESDGVGSYVGNGSGTAIAIRRGGLVPSSVFCRVGQTTSVATTGTAQSGSGLYSKGWPASTSGLLLPDDRVQIGTQLNIVTTRLDSDAAGLAYLECALPWRNPPADNDPIIVHHPMGRYIQTQPDNGWSDVPGKLSSFQFEFEEAMDV